MKKQKSQMPGSTWIVACILLTATAMSFAAGTPAWWNNPMGYPQFHQIVSTGSVYNSIQAQYVTARVDVPNEPVPNASKYVWLQIEYTLTGIGNLLTDPATTNIMWMNDPQLCPASPLDPYPAPPSGQGNLTDRNTFMPAHGFANGREFSYDGIHPQPACERLELQFVVGPNSRLDYRIEVQTVCFALDFGDAPNALGVAQYPTLLASNGARHIIVPNLYMGTTPDAENDGWQSANADGDDLNNTGSPDDEDGVGVGQ